MILRRSLGKTWRLLPRAEAFTSSSSKETSSDLSESTRKWFESIVIGQKLCPFAPPLLANKQLLRIVESAASTEHDAIRDIASEVTLLVGNNAPSSSHETTLVVFHAPFVTEFRDFVRLSWQLQTEAVGERYQSDVQLVLFHPEATHQTYATFSDDADDDSLAADYTIRSPFPTIHLLRETDVLNAVQSGYPSLETLPARNKAKLIAQGVKKCRHRLQECYIP
jgi:hypothetical protein